MTHRRWPPDPLRVLLATALLFIVGAITLVALADPVVDLEEAELAAEAAEARARARAANAPDLAPASQAPSEPVVAKPRARTKKGRLLQERLEKQREERRTKVAAADTSKPEVPRVSLRTGGADAALVERALKKKLGVRFVDDANASWALTLRVDRKAGAGISLKCSVAVAAMPNKNLVASFSSQAGVEGEVSDDELLGDAAEACAGALAEDLGPWLRRGK